MEEPMFKREEKDLATYRNLSEVCQGLKFSATGNSWFLIESAEALRLGFSGSKLRCAFCLGQVHLFKEGTDGTPAHMQHVSAQDARHCVVGDEYQDHKDLKKESRSPVSKAFTEDPAERARVEAEAVKRYPGCVQ